MEKKFAVVAAVVAVLFLWMFRFDMQVVSYSGESGGAVAYVLDRWTGTTHFLAPSFRRELREAKSQ